MIPSPRSSLAAQPSLVLQYVVAHLMREDVREHEPSQRRPGPSDDAFTIGDCARRAET